MILADTSVWIDHLRSKDSAMIGLLRRKEVLMHPMVVAELALGSLHDRRQTLFTFDQLPSVRMAQHREVRELIENKGLYSQGIGLIDAHLLASVLIHPPARLWTRDKRLRVTAEGLSVSASL